MAGKAPDEEVERRDAAGFDESDVAMIFVVWKMTAINLNCVPVDLGVTDASAPRAYSELESAYAAEEGEVRDRI